MAGNEDKVESVINLTLTNLQKLLMVKAELFVHEP
jgi:hypothetical protein